MPDHYILVLVLQPLYQVMHCMAILHLTHDIGDFVFEQGRGGIERSRQRVDGLVSTDVPQSEKGPHPQEHSLFLIA
ncbi:uncharacterized protein METZ01_LOCUS53221 [marine metagenome]|uniref:Uncharacterized protein n=1 Tax=marine metagenome TaxID=408172 RepID=A0A381SDK4_9ZZZZ